MSERKPRRLTVVIGNYGALVHTGVGPDFRRVTISLTELQSKLLTLKKYEDYHTTFVEPVEPTG